jgi:hypothetical protein
MITFASLCLGGFFLMGAAPAIAPSECVASWRETLPKIAAIGAVVTDLPAAVRDNIEANVNAAPPVSNDRLTHAYLAATPGEPMAHLILVTGEDCAIGELRVTPAMLRKLSAPPGDASTIAD